MQQPGKPAERPLIVFYIIFTLLLVLAIWDRVSLLYAFNFQYTDNDQAVEWLMTKDFADGRFIQPCFYGQSYNPALESLLAVPLYKAGMPLYMALPAIAAFLGIIPYLLLAFVFLRQKRFIASYISLAILLIMPLEFSVITSMPRGFVTGIPFAVIGALLVLYRKPGNKSFFLFGLFSTLGITFCPNAIFLSFPVAFYLLATSYRRIGFYLYSAIGISIGMLFPLYIYYFYHYLHPEYVIHRSLYYGTDWDKFYLALEHADKYFEYIFPTGSPFVWVSLALVIFSGIFFYRRQYAKAWTCLLAWLLILFSFAFNKIHEGTETLFYTYDRFFLAVPLLLILLGAWFHKDKLPFRGGRMYLASSLLIGLIGLSSFLMRQAGGYQVEITTPGYIHVESIDSLKKELDQLQEYVNAHNPDLTIFENWSMIEAYAAPAMGYNINSFIPRYERRQWLYKKYAHKNIENILILSGKNELEDIAKKKDVFLDSYEGYESCPLVRNTDMPLCEFLSQFNIECRPGGLR